MAEIFKTIFEAEPQFQGLLKDLDAVNKKYGQSVIEMNKQEEALLALTAQEKKLIDARTKANNPNHAVKLNKELELVKKKIIDLNVQLRATANANQTVGKSADLVRDKMGRAFNVAGLNAARTEVQAIAKDTARIPAETEKVSTGFVTLRTRLKEAREELDRAFDSGIQEDINAASEKVNHLEDSMERLRQTGTGLQRLPSLFRSIGENVLKLDFDNAAKQSKQLLETSKTITFKQAASGVKDLGTTLLNVGKTLLRNPIFLLAAAIIAVIANFEKFKKQGGLIGSTFKAIDAGLGLLSDSFFHLTDAIGLTTVALDELFERQKLFLDRMQSLAKDVGAFRTALIKAQNREGLNVELRGLADQKRIAELRIKLIEDEYKRKGIFTRQLTALEKNQLQEQEELIRNLNAIKGDLRGEDLRSTEREIAESQEKIRLLRRKGFEEEDQKVIEEAEKISRDSFFETQRLKQAAATKTKEKLIELSREIASESDKSKAFDIEFKLKPLSKEQVAKSFALQRAEVNRNRAEEIRVANLEFEDEAKRGEIISQIKTKFALQITLLKKQEALKQIEVARDAADIEIGIAKNQADVLQTILQGNIDTTKALEEARLDIISSKTVDEALKESQKAQIKLDINRKYFAALIKLNEQTFIAQTASASDEIKAIEKTIAAKKEKGFNTQRDEEELAKHKLDLDKLILESTQNRLKTEVDAEKQAAADKRAIADALLQEQLNDNDELTRDENTQLKLRNASQSRFTLAQIHESKRLLDALKAAGQENTKQYRDELAKKTELDKQYVRESIQEYVGYYEQIAQAILQAANQLVQSKLDEVEKLTSLQQKRVDEAKDIADKGNAEMLEAEEKRLDDLNKKREKFVRAQQQLAVIELISNTAIAVSKAAAQGGVAAGVTIAATLVALVAGLAASRTIASQAAYYEGGEFDGYTGQGNPTQTSGAVGAKPYIYHKREFIFNHQKTDKNLDIFRRIHSGNVDLKNWEEKVNAYDSLRSRINERAELHMNPLAITQSNEYKALESKVDKLINAIQGQDRLKLTLTQEGIYGVVSSYEARKDLIKDLAGGK